TKYGFLQVDFFCACFRIAVKTSQLDLYNIIILLTQP
ncbi:MAG: hypothetical protein ACI81T_003757, partial [Bacteroidia bacterium]